MDQLFAIINDRGLLLHQSIASTKEAAWNKIGITIMRDLLMKQDQGWLCVPVEITIKKT